MAAKARNPGVAKGDDVYVQHPQMGPLAVKVLAHGKDGFTGQCPAGRRHKLPYDTVLGHKARVLQSYDVVDQGADGAILEDDKGERRFVRHTAGADAGADAASAPKPSPAGEGQGAQQQDDPLLDRRDLLKATSVDASPAQLEAGNYTKHRVQFQGLPVTIENRAGTMRRGHDAGGHEWAVKMAHDYGYIRGTLGVDGDHFDVLLGPDQGADQAFLFTLKAPPDFTEDDEQKALLGFPDEAAARAAFAGMYDNPRFLGAVHAMPMERFKALVRTTRDEPRFLKATDIMPDPMPILFLKGGQVANRAGLALKDVTDKAGHHTKRWTKTAQDQPAERKPAMMEHGKMVLFRHQNVQGAGKIVGSGRDGVTVHDGQREHQVRHEDLVGPAPTPAPPRSAGGEAGDPPSVPAGTEGGGGGPGAGANVPDYEPRAQGEDDKAYAKRVVDKVRSPGPLPEDHGRYFNRHDQVPHIPLDQMDSSKSDEENKQGGENGPKRMEAAYHGVLGKRDPIKVSKQANGRYKVEDGNGTFTSAKAQGWKSLPAEVMHSATGDTAAVGDTKPLFEPDTVLDLPKDAVQPVKDETGLYEKAAPALNDLQEWLNKGKGLCSQLGYTTMTTAPEDADMGKPGGMLFIAPLKGRQRAAEKVASDYGGDWSRLIDPVRCSIAVDSFDQVHATLAKLQAGGMKLARQPKDRFSKPLSSGYRDALLNITLPNGLVGEVQLHVKPMLKAKGDGHHHYEVQRSLEAQHGNKGDAWPDDAKKQWQDAEDAQIALYGAAWDQAMGQGASKSGEVMAKAMERKAGGKFLYFDRDGAKFRRRADKFGSSIDDVLNPEKGEWSSYKGDAFAVGREADLCEDPLGGGGSGGGGEMMKSLRTEPRLILAKAIIPGGAAGDLLAIPVKVSGHTTKSGTYVAPHTAIRHKHSAPPDHAERHAVAQKAYKDAYAAGDAPRAVDQPSPETKHFYVSAKDGANHHLVAGPYSSHDDALGMVDHVRKHAEKVQPDKAHFMDWGTSGSATPLRTPLGENWKPQSEV